MPWSVAVMVVMIVLVVTIGKVSREKWRALAAQQALPPQGPVASHASDDIRQLKERIAVLERLITDQHGRNDLERQIEELRDR